MPIRSMTDDLCSNMGIRWCRIEFGEQATFDYMKSTVERLARFNMKIYSAVHYCYRRTRCQLGQPGRDQDIEEFNRFLVDCGRLDIPVTNIDWHPANTYTTAEVMTARGYKARQFKLDDFRSKVEKQAFDREYSADDIWTTYTYFIKAVLPVAEKANVKLALHPDDPPLAKMNAWQVVRTLRRLQARRADRQA
jgi:mannonate dehydratase